MTNHTDGDNFKNRGDFYWTKKPTLHLNDWNKNLRKPENDLFVLEVCKVAFAFKDFSLLSLLDDKQLFLGELCYDTKR